MWKPFHLEMGVLDVLIQLAAVQHGPYLSMLFEWE
jgi:hypothetical protein